MALQLSNFLARRNLRGAVLAMSMFFFCLPHHFTYKSILSRNTNISAYRLTFTSGPVSGQKMIVQTTNTGGDLGDNHFDIAMPGGGVGLFNACTSQWGAPPNGWGAQYGGISSRSECDAFPEKLKAGCYWRFDWFKGADNPSVEFKEVTCPRVLTDRTGCVRNGQVPT